MLSPANRALVERDGMLPGLALLLDPPALLERLRRRWPELVLSRLELTYLRYKPQTSCLAGYWLEVNGTGCWLTFTARRPDSLDKLEKALLKTGVPGRFGPGRELLAELAMTMAWFPNDRSLKRLWRAAEPQAQGPLLARLGLPGEARIAMLRYRPERRFVGRVDLRGGAVAVVKLHAPDAYARALGNAAVFTSRGPLVVPRLIGASPRHHAVASEWLEGKPANPDPLSAGRIGAALAALHRQDAPQLSPLTAGDQQAGARAIAEAFGALLPDLADRALALAQRIAPLLDRGSQAVPLHGDCHLEQILDLGTKIALVDFDEAARGPAAWDLGNLLAHLQVGGTAAADLGAFRAALLDGYRCAGGIVGASDLAAQTALALLRLAMRPFREQDRDWPAASAAILDLAETELSRLAAPLPTDPDLPQLSAALDPLHAGACFTAAGLAGTVASAKPVRHKPGRRCLIAYDLVDRSGRAFAAFGKLRAKGADSRVFALQQELWNDGFGPGGWAAARVAEPLALVPALGMWLQAEVRGRPFSPQAFPPDLVAKAIGALHMSRIRPLKRHLLADELAILDARLTALAARRPDWAGRLEALSRAAERLAAQAAPVALRPVHRDFYHDHLLRDGSDVYLIDLDLLCLGDPAVDVGNFNAHLTERALREHGDPRRFAWWQARFAGAACRNPHGARPGNVRIYEFLSLVRLIEIAERMPERRTGAAALLALCEAQVEAAPALSRSPL